MSTTLFQSHNATRNQRNGSAEAKLPREWNYRVQYIRQLAERVCAQDFSPLSCERRAALLSRLESKPVFLLGSTTVYARNFLAAAKERFDVRGVVDDGRNCHEIGGVPRLSSSDFLRLGKGSIAVCLAFSASGKNYFESLASAAGAELLHYMEVADSIPGFNQDHILQGLAVETASQVERLLSIATRFEDAMSIQTLACILTARLTYRREWLESVNVGPETMYFGLDFMPLNTGETVIDCGAFDGDTVEKIRDATADNFQGIIAFEPDPENFSALQRKYSHDNRIRLHRLGISNRSTVLCFAAAQGSFSHAQMGTAPDSRGNSINVIALDSFLQQSPSTVKIDIEGAELEALEGARETIRRHRPKLTIAAYHRPLHLAEIMDAIDQIVPGYSFYLRHHGDFFLETVLYAVPPSY